MTVKGLNLTLHIWIYVAVDYSTQGLKVILSTSTLKYFVQIYREILLICNTKLKKVTFQFWSRSYCTRQPKKAYFTCNATVNMNLQMKKGNKAFKIMSYIKFSQFFTFPKGVCNHKKDIFCPGILAGHSTY